MQFRRELWRWHLLRATIRRLCVKYSLPVRDPGWTAGVAPSTHITFAAPLPDGGAGVKLEWRECAQSWKDCRVLLDCGLYGGTLELTYSSNDTIAGRAVGACTCGKGLAEPDAADCDVSGVK